MTKARGPRPPAGEGREVPRLAADPERAARREFQRRVLRAALIVDTVVVVTLLGGILAWKMRTLLLLVAISLFLTLLLHPLVRILERRGLKRGLATGLVFVFGVLAISTLLFVILTPLVDAAQNLAAQLPRIIRQAEQGRGPIGHFVKRFHLLQYVTAKNGGAQDVISRFGQPALNVGRGVLSAVVSLVTIFFLTFFLLIHAPRIYKGVLEWMQPERAARVRHIVNDVEHSVVGYMAGDFATSLVAGIVVAVTLYATSVPYPLVLGIWVAVVDFLPLVGGLLAGVPTVIIASLHSLTAGIITLIVFLVYQEIENHVLYPIVMSRTVRLNSLWVLISVLIGASLGSIVGSVFGGFVGALLAVPAGSAIQVVARDLWQHRTGAVLLEVAPEDAAGGIGPAGVEAPGPAGGGGASPAVANGSPPAPEAEPTEALNGTGGVGRRPADRDRAHRRRRRRGPPGQVG